MKLALADVDEEGLKQTAEEVSSIVGASNVLALAIDVANLDEVTKFKEKVFETWDEVFLYFFSRSSKRCAQEFTGRSVDEQCWYRHLER